MPENNDNESVQEIDSQARGQHFGPAFQMVADMTIAVIDINRADKWCRGGPDKCKWKCPRPSVFATLLVGWTICLLTTSHAFAQTPDRGLLTGTDLQERLGTRITASWQSNQLGDTLQNLRTSQRIGIFLDRRVDPNQPIFYQANDAPLGQIIYELAEQTGCGVYWMGNVAWFGPLDKATNLAMLHPQLLDSINEMDNSTRVLLLTSRGWSIPRLSQPAELFRQELADLDLDSPRDLPHDVWRDVELPAMRAIERLAVLSFGFDLWVEAQQSESGLALRLLDAPVLERGVIRLPVNRRDSQELLQRLAGEFPDTDITERGKFLEARGTPLELYQLRRFCDFAEYSRAAPGSGRKVVTGRITNSLKNVLRSAAATLDVELQYAPELEEALKQRIDLTVSRVTWPELVERALQNTDLQFDLNEDRLQIRVRDP
ncbi:MAG: hypothetical protein ACR2NP_08305 [Pirellulaceae bacterium]